MEGNDLTTSTVTNKPAVDDRKFYTGSSEIEAAVLEFFRDPCCLLIVNPFETKTQPVECSCCQQIFCHDCSESLLGCKHACPICRNPYKPTRINLKLRSLFELLRVSCQNKKYGCTFKAKYKDIKAHENNCTPESISKQKKPVIISVTRAVDSAYPWILNNLKCCCGQENTLQIVVDLTKIPVTTEGGGTRLYDKKKFFCRVCCQVRSAPESGVLHCKHCFLDICHRCAENIMQNKERFSCSKGHLLALQSKTKSCSSCRIPDDFNLGSWKCDACDLAVCMKCQEAPMKCDNNHVLFRKKWVSSNFFGCNKCKKTYAPKNEGVLCCSTCSYNLCDTCIVNSRSVKGKNGIVILSGS